MVFFCSSRDFSGQACSVAEWVLLQQTISIFFFGDCGAGGGLGRGFPRLPHLNGAAQLKVFTFKIPRLRANIVDLNCLAAKEISHGRWKDTTFSSPCIILSWEGGEVLGVTVIQMTKTTFSSHPATIFTLLMQFSSTEHIQMNRGQNFHIKWKMKLKTFPFGVL